MITAKQVAENASKGTQGPWDRLGSHRSITDFGVYGPVGRYVCSTGGYSDGTEACYQDNTANAIGIASVPDMEALIAEQAAEIARLHDAVLCAKAIFDHPIGRRRLGISASDERLRVFRAALEVAK